MRTRLRPRGLFWHVTWATPLAVLHLFYLFGLFAEGGYNDFTKTYTLADAIVMASKVPLSYAVSSPKILFIPFSLAATAVAGVLLRKRLSRAKVAVVGIARLIASTLVPFFGVAFVLPFLAPQFTFDILKGTTGETYSDGLPTAAAVGWWVWYQMALLWRDIRNRYPDDYGCEKCGYSLVGTPAESPCPECGILQLRRESIPREEPGATEQQQHATKA